MRKRGEDGKFYLDRAAIARIATRTNMSLETVNKLLTSATGIQPEGLPDAAYFGVSEGKDGYTVTAYYAPGSASYRRTFRSREEADAFAEREGVSARHELNRQSVNITKMDYFKNVGVACETYRQKLLSKGVSEEKAAEQSLELRDALLTNESGQILTAEQKKLLNDNSDIINAVEGLRESPIMEMIVEGAMGHDADVNKIRRAFDDISEYRKLSEVEKNIYNHVVEKTMEKTGIRARYEKEASEDADVINGRAPEDVKEAAEANGGAFQENPVEGPVSAAKEQQIDAVEQARVTEEQIRSIDGTVDEKGHVRPVMVDGDFYIVSGESGNTLTVYDPIRGDRKTVSRQNATGMETMDVKDFCNSLFNVSENAGARPAESAVASQEAQQEIQQQPQSEQQVVENNPLQIDKKGNPVISETTTGVQLLEHYEKRFNDYETESGKTVTVDQRAASYQKMLDAAVDKLDKISVQTTKEFDGKGDPIEAIRKADELAMQKRHAEMELNALWEMAEAFNRETGADIAPKESKDVDVLKNNRAKSEGSTMADKQGNPIDTNGKLIVEKIGSIDKLTDEDFASPTRSVELPEIPQNVVDAIGSNGKPVVIKKNVFEKNRDSHKELSPNDSRDILARALYNPILVGQPQAIKRPDYRVAIQTGDKNSVVVLDVFQGKENVEIVGWRRIDAKGLDKMKRQAEREGGQILILSPNDGSAAALSALPHSSSSFDKSSESISNAQGIGQKNAVAENVTLDKDGNIVIKPGETTAQQALDNVKGFLGENAELVDTAIRGKQKEASKELDKINKNKPVIEKYGGNVGKFSRDMKSWEQSVADAEAKVRVWKDAMVVHIQQTGRSIKSDSVKEAFPRLSAEEGGNAGGMSAGGEVIDAISRSQQIYDQYFRQQHPKVEAALREKTFGVDNVVIAKGLDDIRNEGTRELVSQMLEQGDAVPEAFVDADGTVVFYLPGMRTYEPERYARRKVAHELYAHRGLTGLLGSSYEKVMDKVFNDRMSDRDKYEFGRYVWDFNWVGNRGLRKEVLGNSVNASWNELNATQQSEAMSLAGFEVKSFSELNREHQKAVTNAAKVTFDPTTLSWGELTTAQREAVLKNKKMRSLAADEWSARNLEYDEKSYNAGWFADIVSGAKRFLSKYGLADNTMSNNDWRVLMTNARKSSANAGDTESGVRFSAELERVNNRFNKQLSELTEENADKVIMSLGRPSALLQAAGVVDLPMKLYGNKVIKKMNKHGFTLDELQNLPEAVADPIAVFENYGKDGNRSILTELKTKQGNFLVTLGVGKGNDVDFNIVASVFGKGNDNIADWIEKGFSTYINKEKALGYLHHSVLKTEALSSQRLSSVAKIIENFKNPSIGEEKYHFAEEVGLTETDSKYMDALNKGDMETAKRIAVDETLADVRDWRFTPDGGVMVIFPNRKGHRSNAKAKLTRAQVDELRRLRDSKDTEGAKAYALSLVHDADARMREYEAKRRAEADNTKMTYDNFYQETIGMFHEVETPEREPDYVSRKRNGEVSSSYWYDTDEQGDYVIRQSDHWSMAKPSIPTSALYEESYAAQFATPIASCTWYLQTDKSHQGNKEHAGKIYLSDLHKKVRFSVELDETNHTFNKQLSELTEENADKVAFDLGRPSAILRSAGVTDMPMKLYGSKVIKKMKKHGFTLDELQNLPEAVADPIAVFDNYNETGNRSVLTELKTNQGNFLVTLDFGKGHDIDFNIVTSLFGKSDNKIVNWINDGYTMYVNKEKARNYLHLAAPIAAASNNRELISAAKIIENFENPSIGEEKNMRFSMHTTREEFDDARRRAVESRGIVNDNLPESVRVTSVPRHDFAGDRPIEQAREWANDNIVGRHTTDDGMTYDISRSAISKYLSQSTVGKSDNLGVHLSALTKLPEIINNSIDVEIHPDYKKGEDGVRSVENGLNSTNMLVHRMYGAINIDGTIYRVKTTMHEFSPETGRSNRPHSYEVTKIEVLDESGTSVGAQSPNGNNTEFISGTTKIANNSQIRNGNPTKIEVLGQANTSIGAQDAALVSDKIGPLGTTKLLNGVEKSYEPGVKVIKNVILDAPEPAKNDILGYARKIVDNKNSAPRMSAAESPLYGEVKEIRSDAVDANAEAREKRIDAVRSVGGDMVKIRSAMARQREYDKATAKQLTYVVQRMIKEKLLGDLSPQEIIRITGAIKNGTGKESILREVDKLMDIMLKNQLGNAKAEFDNLLNTKASKVNASGVKVQGKLDADGAALLESVKRYKGLGDEVLEKTMSDLQDKLNGSDDATSSDARQRYMGALLVKQMNERITECNDHEASLKLELENAKDSHKRGEISKEAYMELVDAINESILLNKIERISAYKDMNRQLSGEISASILAAKDWKNSVAERASEVQHMCNSDLKGVDNSPEHKKFNNKWYNQLNNFAPIRVFLNPVSTWETVLRSLGVHDAEGKGYLYNHFFRGANEASEKEWLGIEDAMRAMDGKASEVFGKKMKWESMMKKVNGMPIIDVEWNVKGKPVVHPLTQGQALYIYLANNQTDGRMKLRAMGITEDAVEGIVGRIDPRVIEIGDWMQKEFLVGLRNKYNETYRRVFGTNMTANENYFPL